MIYQWNKPVESNIPSTSSTTDNLSPRASIDKIIYIMITIKKIFQKDSTLNPSMILDMKSFFILLSTCTQMMF